MFLDRVTLKIGGLKFAKVIHNIRPTSDVETRDVNIPPPINEFRSDKFQAAYIMYSFLKKRNLVERGQFLQEYNDDDVYTWTELHLAHLCKVIFMDTASTIPDILSHIFFWDIKRIVSFEDRMQQYCSTHYTMKQYIEAGKILVFDYQSWSENVPQHIVNACFRVNRRTLVGLLNARRNRRHHRDEDDQIVQYDMGKLQKANFEFCESRFPSFTLYLYIRLASYRPSRGIFLFNTAEFRRSQYFPSSPNFYRAVSSCSIRQADPDIPV